MGNTLDQHRVAIGGFAARQVSPNWTPSSSSVCQRFERTGKDGGKTRGRLGQLVQLVLLVSIFSSGFTTAQKNDGDLRNAPLSAHLTTLGSSEQQNVTTSDLRNRSLRGMQSFETPTTTVVVNGYQVSFGKRR